MNVKVTGDRTQRPRGTLNIECVEQDEMIANEDNEDWNKVVKPTTYTDCAQLGSDPEFSDSWSFYIVIMIKDQSANYIIMIGIILK